MSIPKCSQREFQLILITASNMNALPSAGGYVLSGKRTFTVVFSVAALHCHMKAISFCSYSADILGCCLLAKSECVC